MTDKEVEERIASAVALGIEKQREKEREVRRAKNKKSSWAIAIFLLIIFTPIIWAIWKTALASPIPSKQEAFDMCVARLADFGLTTELTIQNAVYEAHGYMHEPENAIIGRLHLQGVEQTEDGDEETVDCLLTSAHVYYLNYRPFASPDGATLLVNDSFKETLYTEKK